MVMVLPCVRFDAVAAPAPPAVFDVSRSSTIQRTTADTLDYSLPSLPTSDTAILVMCITSHGSQTAPTCTHNQTGTAFASVPDAEGTNGTRIVCRAFLLNPGAIATPSGTFTITVASAGSDEIQFLVAEITAAHATALEQAEFVLETAWDSSGNAVAITTASDYSTADNLVFSWHGGRTASTQTVTEPGSTVLLDKRTGTAFADGASGFCVQAVASTTKASHTWTHSAGGFGDGVVGMVVLKAA